MDFLSARHRYHRDSLFRAVVDALYCHIADMKLTPTEIREAAMLAAIKFEELNPRPPFSITAEQRDALLGGMTK